MNTLLTFKVGALLGHGIGSSEQYSFQGPLEFEDFSVVSDLKAKVEFMRIDGGINVHLIDFSVDIERQCSKSLEKYIEEIRIKSAERQYYEIPQDDGDPNDVYTIDMKHKTLDLTEMIRQEIILHLSPIPVSSSGSELKWVDKDAPEEGDLGNKPFAKLKDLLK